MATATTERPRLKQRYDSELRVQLKETLGLGNIMEVPGFEKIVVNMGVGRATQQTSLLEGAVRDLTLITGQKPLVTKAKISVAGIAGRSPVVVGGGQVIGADDTGFSDNFGPLAARVYIIPPAGW